MTPRFDTCVSIATDLLYRQKIKGTKIDITKLKYDKNIIFDSIQHYCEITGASLNQFANKKGLLSEGCTIYALGFYFVLHNDKDQLFEHLNWTRAHEIGHIYLGHKTDNDRNEVEAHYFAAQLLMPEYVMNQIKNLTGEHSAYHTCQLFNVSYEAACKRVNTMKRKTIFRESHKDAVVYEAMKEDIYQYFNVIADEADYIPYRYQTSLFDDEDARKLRIIEEHYLYGI